MLPLSSYVAVELQRGVRAHGAQSAGREFMRVILSIVSSLMVMNLPSRKI